MNKLERYTQLLEILEYGHSSAKTADDIFKQNKFDGSPAVFKRRLRELAQEARLNGHRVIGNEKGYFIALTQEEWEQFRNRRFTALNAEIKSIAACDRISISDPIKNVYSISVTDDNYNLF